MSYEGFSGLRLMVWEAPPKHETGTIQRPLKEKAAFLALDWTRLRSVLKTDGQSTDENGGMSNESGENKDENKSISNENEKVDQTLDGENASLEHERDEAGEYGDEEEETGEYGDEEEQAGEYGVAGEESYEQDIEPDRNIAIDEMLDLAELNADKPIVD